MIKLDDHERASLRLKLASLNRVALNEVVLMIGEELHRRDMLNFASQIGDVLWKSRYSRVRFYAVGEDENLELALDTVHFVDAAEQATEHLTFRNAVGSDITWGELENELGVISIHYRSNMKRDSYLEVDLATMQAEFYV